MLFSYNLTLNENFFMYMLCLFSILFQLKLTKTSQYIYIYKYVKLIIFLKHNYKKRDETKEKKQHSTIDRDIFIIRNFKFYFISIKIYSYHMQRT